MGDTRRKQTATYLMTVAVSRVWETQIQVPPSKLLVRISLVYTKCQIKLAQSLKKLCGMLNIRTLVHGSVPARRLNCEPCEIILSLRELWLSTEGSLGLWQVI